MDLETSPSFDVERQLDLARLLVYRLERLSADSFWAHRASGLRGSLLLALERLEGAGQSGSSQAAQRQLEILMRQAFTILANAAREIRTPELYGR